MNIKLFKQLQPGGYSSRVLHKMKKDSQKRAIETHQQNRSYDHVNIKLLKQLQLEGYSSMVLHKMKTMIAKKC